MPAPITPLLQRAERDFYDAFATFGAPDEDFRVTAQKIAEAAEASGFDPQGKRRLHAALNDFIQLLEENSVDPRAYGRPAPQPGWLFSPSRLGGIFNEAAPPPDNDQSRDDEPDAQERALIEQLIAATKLYDTSDAVQELLDFTVRLREFAPFNAMLLHVQKPGLTHAATARDWHTRFGRAPKPGTRPLLVLRMMGPVDFVFDIQDTEGREVPENAFAFPTLGKLTDAEFYAAMENVTSKRIKLIEIDAGDGQAGWIRLSARAQSKSGLHFYELGYNKNHPAPTRLVTVAHELAHLYLGHLGADPGRKVPDGSGRPKDEREVEAEMAAYLVAMRNGLKPRSESYLTSYKGAFERLNLYAVTRAANAIETILGISAQKMWNEKADADD